MTLAESCATTNPSACSNRLVATTNRRGRAHRHDRSIPRRRSRRSNRTSRPHCTTRHPRAHRRSNAPPQPPRLGWNPETSTGAHPRWPIVYRAARLDHFKAFNDANGHSAGDQLLREAAIQWRAQLRDDDYLARIGGEEFAVLLPGCDQRQAAACCNGSSERHPMRPAPSASPNTPARRKPSSLSEQTKHSTWQKTKAATGSSPHDARGDETPTVPRPLLAAISYGRRQYGGSLTLIQPRCPGL